MGFGAHSFTFDNIPSETFGLYIRTSDGGEALTEGGSIVEPIIQKVYGRSKFYLLGVEETSPLTFELEFYSPNPISPFDEGRVRRWLTGHKQYKPLYVVSNDEDYSDIVFNVLITSLRSFKVGNVTHGFTATVQLDSQYAWSFPQTVSYAYTEFVNTTIRFNNLSDSNNYLYPKLVFKMNNSGGDISIKNANDQNREFKFTGLSANETITIDNDLKTISSSTGLLRLEKFNKKWFRFAPGVNVLIVVGNISSLSFTYQLSKKIGG
jgi:hypothetical protein